MSRSTAETLQELGVTLGDEPTLTTMHDEPRPGLAVARGVAALVLLLIAPGSPSLSTTISQWFRN